MANETEILQEDTQQAEQLTGTTPTKGRTKSTVDVENIKKQVQLDTLAQINAQLKDKLGVESLEDLIARKQEQDRKADEEKGEFKKIAEQEREARLKVEAMYREAVAKSTITTALANANVLYVEDIYAALASKASVDEKGEVKLDGKNVDTYLAQYLKDRPGFVKSQAKPGSGTAEGTGVSEEDALKAEIEKAKKEKNPNLVLALQGKLMSIRKAG